MLQRAPLFLVLLVSVTLGACAGDDTGDSDTDATTTASTTAGTTETTTAGTTETTTTTDGTTDPTTTDGTTDPTTTDDTTTTTTDPTTTTTDPTTTTTTDPTTSTTDDTTTTGDVLGPFEMDVYPIIAANCSCHVGGSPGGLAMPDAATAHANLVDTPAGQTMGALDRVAPGDPESSYLIHKLNGTQMDVGGSGTKMPQGGALDPAEINVIIDWINDGAPF